MKGSGSFRGLVLGQGGGIPGAGVFKSEPPSLPIAGEAEPRGPVAGSETGQKICDSGGKLGTPS